MDFNILFNDKDIVVCIKPQGIISQSDSKGKENMVDLLCKKTNNNVFPVHRLDKETGGIMVFAKSQKVAAALSRQIIENKFKKEYLALIHNNICPESGEIIDLLFWDRQRNKSFVVKKERKGVKKAILKYEKLCYIKNQNIDLSLIKVLLLTGRTHQIRVQFSNRGYPLVGDNRYGARDSEKQLGLWACKLSFYHPITNELLSFESLPYNSSVFDIINFNEVLI